MLKSKQLSSNRTNAGLKILIGLAMGIAIYYHLSWRGVWSVPTEILSGRIGYLVVATGLLPLNWFLESAKWRLYMRQHVPMGWSTSVRSVLAGLSLGVFTPSRVGEYGGRLFFVAAKHNYYALQSTFVCSLAQNIISLIVGMLGMMYYVHRTQPVWILERGLLWFLIIGLGLIIILFYFNLNWLYQLARRLGLSKRRWVGKLLGFGRVSQLLLLQMLMYSLLRYSVYTLQYALVLCYFGVPAQDWWLFLSAIGTIFLVQGSIPLPPFLGILARGEIAIFVWKQLAVSSSVVLPASYMIWVLNILIPALVGYFFILNVNILKSLGFDQSK